MQMIPVPGKICPLCFVLVKVDYALPHLTKENLASRKDVIDHKF